MFKKVEFEIILYDEIETFKDFNDKYFDYPYGQRKTKIHSVTIGPDFYGWGGSGS